MAEHIVSAIAQYDQVHGRSHFAPRAVLFDMDGVLFDSMPHHATSWAAVCTRFGLKMSPEEAYMHEGRTGAATINILMQRYHGREATADEIRDIYAAKCEAFNACPEAVRMPGAYEVTRRAVAEGLKIGVVTGSGQKSLLDRLTAGFPGCFTPDRIVSSADVTHGKPHPEPYLRGLDKMGVEAHEAIVVENAPLGIRAAVAAGIFTIAVNTGPLPDEVLLAERPNLLYHSMSQLADSPIFAYRGSAEDGNAMFEKAD